MILIADQNRSIGDLLVRRLHAEGLAAQTAGTAALAHDIAETAAHQGILDALIVDPALPGGGLELVRRVRALPDGSTVPIVVVGTSDAKEDVAAAWEAGATTLLVKGKIAPQDLIEQIVRLTGAVRPRKQVSTEPADYFLNVQLGADAVRLSGDSGGDSAFRCVDCGSPLVLYVRRDPSKWGDWLAAKVGCRLCAGRHREEQQQVVAIAVGGAS